MVNCLGGNLGAPRGQRGIVQAVLVKVTVKDEEAGRQMLREEVVPRASAAPGFVAGYWTRSAGDTSGVLDGRVRD